MSDVVPHLLVVDDDERIRGLLQKFLIRNGFLVSIARDAAQARRLLSGLEFDFLVLDVMMPGETGSRGLRRGPMTIWSNRLSRVNYCCGSMRSCAACRRSRRPMFRG